MIFCVEDDPNIRELEVYTLNLPVFRRWGLKAAMNFLKHWKPYCRS